MSELKATGLKFNPTLPVVGCLFPPSLSTWVRYADGITDADRARQGNWIAAQWPGLPNTRYIQCLLTAYADDAQYKVNLFEGKERWGRKWDYGCDLNYAKMAMVRADAQMISGVNALWFPTWFCDDRSIYSLSMDIHERAISLVVPQLSPYCVAWTIGLEDTEYLPDLATRNAFSALFRKYAPGCAVLAHRQWDGTSPLGDINGLLYEFPFDPGEGDKHSPEEVRDIGARIIANANQQGKFVIFSEINTHVEGAISRQQQQLLYRLPGCVGIGGPM